MVQAVVALGGNLGDVARTFRLARTLTERHEQVQSVEAAGLYRSTAMGAAAGAEFCNSAWLVETSLEPLDLLNLLQQIENELGRTRDVHWGPRMLDLDLIFYGEEKIASQRLTVPHPHCWYRRFVLTPIENLLPDFRHPVLELSIRELCERLQSTPFRLALGSASEKVQPLECVVSEFPGIETTNVTSPQDFDLADVSLAVWFGESDAVALHPLWLAAPIANAEQFLRDTLTAACTELSSVSKTL